MLEFAERRVAAFIFVEDQIVLVRAKRSGARVPPKGKLKAGETDTQAARREAREEAGVIGELFISECPVAQYIHGTTHSEKHEVIDCYVLIADPRDFRPEQAEPERKPKLYPRDGAIARVLEDVRKKRRPEASDSDLVAAIRKAFSFVDEVRQALLVEPVRE